jgi:chaperonin cofactor prefoldin
MTAKSLDLLIAVAKKWPHDQLKEYIENLEGQIEELKELVRELRAVERQKQKEINRKLESGTRGGS